LEILSENPSVGSSILPWPTIWKILGVAIIVAPLFLLISNLFRVPVCVNCFIILIFLTALIISQFYNKKSLTSCFLICSLETQFQKIRDL